MLWPQWEDTTKLYCNSIKGRVGNWGHWYCPAQVSTFQLLSGTTSPHSSGLCGLGEVNAIPGSNSAFQRWGASGFSLLKREISNCWQGTKSTETSNWDLVVVRRTENWQRNWKGNLFSSKWFCVQCVPWKYYGMPPVCAPPTLWRARERSSLRSY